MADPDLKILSPQCLLCAACGFTTGSEFFDPLVLPYLADFDAYPNTAWRVHRHAGEPAVYFLEVVLPMGPPYGGFLQFDGPPHEEPGEAVRAALAHVRTGLCLEEA